MRAWIVADLQTRKPKEAREILERMSGILSAEAAMSEIVPIRKASRHLVLTAKAARGAVALFRVHLPAFLAAVRR